jgi:hypothetical protein
MPWTAQPPWSEKATFTCSQNGPPAQWNQGLAVDKRTTPIPGLSINVGEHGLWKWSSEHC